MKKNNTIKIYSLNCPKNGSVKYIGKTEGCLQKRLSQHLSKYSLIKRTLKNNWIKSLLNDNLYPNIQLIEEVPKNEWEYWEKFWIEQFRQWGFVLKNSAEGGQGGKTKWKKGKKHHFYGVKYNEQKRKNIAKSLYGKHKDISIRYKVSRQVIQMSLTKKFIHKWNSLTEASESLNISRSSISLSCSGKRKSAGGFIWKYVDNDIRKRKLSNLNKKDVEFIIKSYKSGLLNQRELSLKFNISIPYISRIINKTRKFNSSNYV